MINCSNLNLEKQGQSDPPLLCRMSSQNVSQISLTDEGNNVQISRKASYEGYPTSHVTINSPQGYMHQAPDYTHNNSLVDTLQVFDILNNSAEIQKA